MLQWFEAFNWVRWFHCDWSNKFASSGWFARSGHYVSASSVSWPHVSKGCISLPRSVYSCLEQNSRSGCGLFCWSFCLWVSKRWNHFRDQSSTYSHEVSSISLMVLCQVAEMVRMETRAVSREFSDSKARAFAVTESACHYVLRRFGWLICSS